MDQKKYFLCDTCTNSVSDQFYLIIIIVTVPIPGAFFKPNLMLELSDGNVGTGCRVTDSSFIVTTLATHSYLFSPGCSSGVSMMRRGEGSGAGKLFLWPQSGWSSSAFVLLPRLPQAFRCQYTGWFMSVCQRRPGSYRSVDMKDF